MPGFIRVSVLEAVELPEVLTDGTIGKDVTAKVTLGPRLFKTQPGVADGGRIESWNSDFAFPVMNLRDKLVISICDSEDHSVTQTAIEIPSIIQKGSRDEFVSLNKGGRIHLRMSFVLTQEERKKIEVMRVAALKRKKEAERLKKTVILQPVIPEKELKNSPVSTVAITEVDVSTTGDRKDLNEEFEKVNDRKDSTMLGDKKDAAVLDEKPDSITAADENDLTTSGEKKDSTPKPMFNYAKAFGLPPSAKKTPKKPSAAAVSDDSTIEAKVDTGDVNSGVQTVRESAKDAGEVVSSEATRLDSSVQSPSSGHGAAPLVTKAVDSTPQTNLIPPGGSDGVNNEVKAKMVDVNSEVQTGRESAENAEELGNSKLGGAAPPVTEPAESVDSVAQASPPPTKAEPGVSENSITEVGKANKDGIDSESQTVREAVESAEEVGTSVNSKLDSSVADASPSSEQESASLMITSTDSASKGNMHQAIRSSSSGPITVKARVKRTLSRVSSRRSSNRVSSSNSLSRTPPPVPLVLVQQFVKRALSNIKGCYGLRPSAVNH